MCQALPRIAGAEEIADLTAFLLGPGGRHITGAVLRVDGGTVPTLSPSDDSERRSPTTSIDRFVQ